MVAIGLSYLPAHLDMYGDPPKRLLCESFIMQLRGMEGSLSKEYSLFSFYRASMAPLNAYKKHASKKS